MTQGSNVRVQRVDFLADIHCDADRADGILATPDPATGFLRLDARLTRTGVFTYRDAEGKAWGELRTPEAVFHADSVASFQSVVATNNHPERFVDTNNVRDVQVGHIGGDVRRDGNFLAASVVITDAATIIDIQRGKQQLSCGYTANVVADSGEINGERFDGRQTNIRGNHVAIVTKGRAGPDCALLTRGDAAYSEVDMAKKNDNDNAPGGNDNKAPAPAGGNVDPKDAPKDAPKEEVKVAAPGAKVAPISNVVPEGDDTPKALDDVNVLRARLDALELDKKTRDAEFTSRVDERVALVSASRAIVPKLKTDGISDVDVMRAVVLEVSPGLKDRLDANANAPGYLKSSYDTAIELHASRKRHVDNFNGVVFDAMHNDDDDNDPDKCMDDYFKRRNDAARNAMKGA